MMLSRRFATSLAIAFVAAILIPSVSQSAIVASGSQSFAEPNGFYSGIKRFSVYPTTSIYGLTTAVAPDSRVR